MLALMGINIFRPPLTVIVNPESITCYFWLIILTVISATSSVARVVFVEEIITSSSIYLLGESLNIVKFFDEFLIENFISCCLQIDIYLKLHSFGLQITKHSGTTEIHFKSIFFPFFIFNFKFYYTFPPPSGNPKKLWTMQMFYFPNGYNFPLDGDNLNNDYF